MKAGVEQHEPIAQGRQASAAAAQVGLLEDAGAAQTLEPHGVGGEPGAEPGEALGVEAAQQAVMGHGQEVAQPLRQGAAQDAAGGLRQDGHAHHPGAADAEGDLQQAPHRLQEGALGLGHGRQPHQAGGIAGEQEGIAAKVPIARRPAGAITDPQHQGAEQQDPLLGEQGDGGDGEGQPGETAQDPIETLGQHLSALRLQDDEDGDQHGARLRQLQAIGQPQRQGGGEQGLGDEGPGLAVGAGAPGIQAGPAFARNGAGRPQGQRRSEGHAGQRRHRREGGARRSASAAILGSRVHPD
ncbi:hypothetical protein Q3H58_002290 [Pseudomonas psychrotolerans]|nr:hypothetical protein [Pseudomonas psychrotolerans]